MATEGGTVSKHRREPTAQGGFAEGRILWRLEVVGGRREGRKHIYARRNRAACADLPDTAWRRGMGRRRRTHTACRNFMPLRRCAPMVPLPRCSQRKVGRAEGGKAIPRPEILRLPSLPWNGIFQSVRRTHEPAQPTCQQDTHGAERGTGDGITAAKQAEGHALAHLLTENGSDRRGGCVGRHCLRASSASALSGDEAGRCAGLTGWPALA